MNYERLAGLIAAFFGVVAAIIISLAIFVGGLQLAYKIMVALGLWAVYAGAVIFETVIIVVISLMYLVFEHEKSLNAWIERQLEK